MELNRFTIANLHFFFHIAKYFFIHFQRTDLESNLYRARYISTRGLLTPCRHRIDTVSSPTRVGQKSELGRT